MTVVVHTVLIYSESDLDHEAATVSRVGGNRYRTTRNVPQWASGLTEYTSSKEIISGMAPARVDIDPRTGEGVSVAARPITDFETYDEALVWGQEWADALDGKKPALDAVAAAAAQARADQDAAHAQELIKREKRIAELEYQLRDRDAQAAAAQTEG